MSEPKFKVGDKVTLNRGLDRKEWEITWSFPTSSSNGYVGWGYGLIIPATIVAAYAFEYELMMAADPKDPQDAFQNLVDELTQGYSPDGETPYIYSWGSDMPKKDKEASAEYCDHDLAVYDSGFTRSMYCKKCNKDYGPC